MCGIAGITGSTGNDVIKKMTDVMVHRGPDDSGFYHDEHIALGQRRLSIIDLESGRQPISNETDTLQLVCNGEIYNSPQLREALKRKGHQFKTETDVEVILHLYEDHGAECVRHLRGMFAFAIWDTQDKRLFMARDHLGQKPLFFCKRDGRFAFASEIKSLLAAEVVKPEIDLDGLWHYLSLRFIPDQYSLFKGIHKLPAATCLTYERDQVSTQRYWDVDFKNKNTGSEVEIEEELNNLLLATVKEHLLSDVRVGAFLSGGIDSGTIASMMAVLSDKKIPRFSIGTREVEFNELPYAKMVSDRYGMESHEEIVEPDLIHAIPDMIYHMDEPSDPFGFGVYLVAQNAAKHVKVVLGGDGGDENFAGYDRFFGQRLVDYYCLLPKWFRQGVVKKISDRIPESYGYKSLAQKAAWVNEMSLFSGGERYAQSLGVLRFTHEAKQQLFTEEARQQVTDNASSEKILRFFNAENADHVVDKMLYTDLMTRIPDHLLTIGDRMTMAHSLESRAPLIDYKIVEFAAAIPANLKLKGRQLKYILRKVASRYMPPELIHLKKQGFRFPLGIWFRTDLKKFLRNLFSQSRFVELGIFNQGYINGMLEEHISGKVDHNYRIWVLLNLEIWYRIYFEGETVDSMREYTNRLM
ncbi:MAG: asparagine synthase (glutamine-hydrolyzing) [Gammaproteobacteria bacterium]|nr:asparagine synthase (glutamine-hydrolyzing) [Gammaproteobacteria bacterium]